MDPDVTVESTKGVIQESAVQYKDEVGIQTQSGIDISLHQDLKNEGVYENHEEIFRHSGIGKGDHSLEVTTEWNPSDVTQPEVSDPKIGVGSHFPTMEVEPKLTDVMLPPRREIRASQRIPKYLPDVNGDPWKVWGYPEVPTVETEYETDPDADPNEVRYGLP